MSLTLACTLSFNPVIVAWESCECNVTVLYAKPSSTYSHPTIIHVCIPPPRRLVLYQACPAFVHSEANAVSAINVLKLSKLM